MNILCFEYSIDDGFAWIVVDGKEIGEKFHVSCCLSREDGSFSKKIIMTDCGHNWGICGETNAKAFAYWGENRCMKALFSESANHGIELL